MTYNQFNTLSMNFENDEEVDIIELMGSKPAGASDASRPTQGKKVIKKQPEKKKLGHGNDDKAAASGKVMDAVPFQGGLHPPLTRPRDLCLGRNLPGKVTKKQPEEKMLDHTVTKERFASRAFQSRFTNQFENKVEQGNNTNETQTVEQRADGDSNSKTETPLLTAPSDEPLGVVWVPCVSEGTGMGDADLRVRVMRKEASEVPKNLVAVLTKAKETCVGVCVGKARGLMHLHGGGYRSQSTAAPATT